MKMFNLFRAIAYMEILMANLGVSKCKSALSQYDANTFYLKPSNTNTAKRTRRDYLENDKRVNKQTALYKVGSV